MEGERNPSLARGCISLVWVPAPNSLLLKRSPLRGGLKDSGWRKSSEWCIWSSTWWPEVGTHGMAHETLCKLAWPHFLRRGSCLSAHVTCSFLSILRVFLQLSLCRDAFSHWDNVNSPFKTGFKCPFFTLPTPYGMCGSLSALLVFCT